MDVGAGLQALALFGFLAVVVWLGNRKDEREAANRHEIYRRMMDSSGGSVDAVRELMQRDEDRRDQKEIDGQRFGGMITTVVGVGLATFLYAIRPERPIYLIGLAPFLVGVVMLLHASARDRRRRGRRSASP